MDVSIIIVNYNTCRMTSECIDSVMQKTEGLAYEIILVDNASTDGSKEYFENDPRVTYIYNSENIGFGRANNEGLKVARGRNIFFLNSDTLLINNAIQLLSDFLDADPGVGAVGGNLYSASQSPAHSYRRLSPLSFELSVLLAGIPAKLFFKGNQEHNFTMRPIAVNYIVGADLMIKKAVLDTVGPFDRRFFMYCEETELCHRIRKAGYKVVSVPQAQIIHLEGRSFATDKQVKRIFLNYHSVDLYCRLHYGRL